MTKPITINLLKKNEACPSQVVKFNKIFGWRIKPTRELCLLHAQDFNFDWAQCLLPSPVRKVYNEIVIVRWKAYQESLDTAEKVFKNTNTIIAWSPHNNPAENVYIEVTASAKKVYKEFIALAWFDAWENQI